MSNKIIYKTGSQIGKCIFIRDVTVISKYSRAIFLCKCGNEFESLVQHVKAEKTISCGCHKKRHGMRNTIEYKTWCSMKERCLNTNSEAFHYYGGRGITICERWLGKDGFKNFFLDMGQKPSPKHSIERMEVNGNYEPSNCKWATRTEQSRNTRRNKFITYNGYTKTIAEWAEITGINYFVIIARFNANWAPDKMLNTPAIIGRNQFSS